jgi:mannosyl-oligosaccharide glucosidase
MPLAALLLPPGSAELGAQMRLLRGAGGGVWTPHGVRSLSAHSTLYGARNTRDDAPYWRGAIWVNFNYLVMQASFF